MKKTTILSFLFLFCSLFLSGQTDEVTLAINDSIQLTLERARFDTTGKSFEYYDEEYPYSINGSPIFGTDGGYPKYTLTGAHLKIGRKHYDLESDHMYEPWFGDGPNINSFKLKYDGSEMRISGLFSDGAGSYGAEWLIVGNSVIRTILTKDEWILIEYFGGGE
jgi:hypothetical protein